MQTDKTTLSDLSIFHAEEEQSIFHHLNFTTTTGGREWFHYFLAHPHSDIKKIQDTQEVIKLILNNEAAWPGIITNGTVMVVHKFYETAFEEIPAAPNTLNSRFYQLVNGPDFSLLRYSLNHFLDFAIGLKQLIDLLFSKSMPSILQVMIERIAMLVNKPVLQQMMLYTKGTKLSVKRTLTYARFLRLHYKADALELLELYSKLDAYYGMAMACKKYNLCFPVVAQSATPVIEAKGLFHLLLHQPVDYDITLDQQTNFLFLTGANMAGKSTFIKAMGVAVYLAHIGMGVPAQSLHISLFDGLLSNIQVEDNLSRGESYFYNEVKRVKKTIDKINDGRNWLILIDELFKGTNVQDAMKCSTIVIEGLRKMKNAVFILSTHLYEIGEGLQQYTNIQFSYFETKINEGQLEFSYQLKKGISNDRLGYLILKREGVVKLLENL